MSTLGRNGWQRRGVGFLRLHIMLRVASSCAKFRHGEDHVRPPRRSAAPVFTTHSIIIVTAQRKSCNGQAERWWLSMVSTRFSQCIRPPWGYMPHSCWCAARAANNGHGRTAGAGLEAPGLGKTDEVWWADPSTLELCWFVFWEVMLRQRGGGGRRDCTDWAARHSR